MGEQLQSSQSKHSTRYNAARKHLGDGHWHVRIRTSVIVCGACEAAIPKSLKPKFCPVCGAGRVS